MTAPAALPEIEGYDVLRELGRGAMGVVYLARDRLLEREVAVKFLTNTGDPLGIERFVREARAMARLSHPNVVTVFRAGVTQGEPYVVMELLRGRSLEELLERSGPLDAARLLEVAIGATRGVAAAHARGIVHRDLKPSNLFETDDGTIKVLDFGIAKLLTAPARGPDTSTEAEPRAQRSATEVLAPGATGPASGGATAPEGGRDDERDADPATASTMAQGHAAPAAGSTLEYGQPAPRHGPVRVDGSVADEEALAATRSGDRSANSDEGTTLTGTPLYMAPEVWREEGADHSSDVWSLGATLYMLASGAPPFPGRTVPEIAFKVLAATPAEPLASKAPALPSALCEVVDRTLAKARPRRYASAQELLVELERVAREGRGAGVRLEGSPYPGLRPMNEGDRARFFGREEDVSRVVERLRSDPFVVLVGPSGTGKSSLAAAGVAPAIAEGALGEPARWRVLRVAPGPAPTAVLANALAPLLAEGQGASSATPSGVPREPEALAQALREGPDVLARALRELGARDGRGVLLLIDQLEELVTIAQADERDAAAAALGRLVELAPSGVRVLATARSDLFDRLGSLGALGVLLGRATELVRPLTGAALREAIVLPARAAGATIEDPAIVDAILADAGAGEGALPLVAFAMRAWWELRDRERAVLTRAGWEQVGGVAGALGGHAEAVYTSLSGDDRQTTRDVLLKLVNADGTRRYATGSELALASRDEGSLARVLGALGRARLLNVEGDGLTARVTVMHEALVRAWPRLGSWLAEGREDRALHERVKQAAAVWEAAGRSAGLLWRGALLLEVARWREVYDDLLEPGERAFLEASARAERVGRRVLGAAALVLFVGLGGLALAGFRRAGAAEQRGVAQHASAERFARAARSEAAARGGEIARTQRDEDPSAALAWLAVSARGAGRVSATARLLALGLAGRGVGSRYACTAPVALRADGTRAACADGAIVRVFDVEAGGAGAIDALNAVRAVAVADSDEAIAWVDANGALKVSDGLHGVRRLATDVRGYPSLALAPDGRSVAWLERGTGKLYAASVSDAGAAPSAAPGGATASSGRLLCAHAVPQEEAGRAELWHGGNGLAALLARPDGSATLRRFATRSAGGDDVPPTHRLEALAYARRGPLFAWLEASGVVRVLELGAGAVLPCAVRVRGGGVERVEGAAPASADAASEPRALSPRDGVRVALSPEDGRVALLVPPPSGVAGAPAVWWYSPRDGACALERVEAPEGVEQVAWLPGAQLGVWGSLAPLHRYDVARAQWERPRGSARRSAKDARAIATGPGVVLLAGDSEVPRAALRGSAPWSDPLGLGDAPVRAGALDSTGLRALLVDVAERLFFYRAWPPELRTLARWTDEAPSAAPPSVADPAQGAAAGASLGVRASLDRDGRVALAAPGYGAVLVEPEGEGLRVRARRAAPDSTAVASRGGTVLLGLRDGGGVLLDLLANEEVRGTLLSSGAAPTAVALSSDGQLAAVAGANDNPLLRTLRGDGNWPERTFRPFSELNGASALGLINDTLVVGARWLGFVNDAGLTTLAREPAAFAERRVAWIDQRGGGPVALTTDDCSAWWATCTASECTVERATPPGEACAAAVVDADALVTAAPGRGVRLWLRERGPAGVVLAEAPLALAGDERRVLPGHAAALALDEDALVLVGPPRDPFVLRVALPPSAVSAFDAWVALRTNVRVGEGARVQAVVAGAGSRGAR